MRVPLFRDRPSFRPPKRGPLVGRVVLAVAPPSACDVRALRRFRRALYPLGVHVAVATECQGEVYAEHGRSLIPELLLVDALGRDWDALVFAGGEGAGRVAEDPLAQSLRKLFLQRQKLVAPLLDPRGTALGVARRLARDCHVPVPGLDSTP